MLQLLQGKPLGVFKYTYMLKMQIRITLVAYQE